MRTVFRQFFYERGRRSDTRKEQDVLIRPDAFKGYVRVPLQTMAGVSRMPRVVKNNSCRGSGAQFFPYGILDICIQTGRTLGDYQNVLPVLSRLPVRANARQGVKHRA